MIEMFWFNFNNQKRGKKTAYK